MGIPIFVLALPLMLMILVNNGIIEPINTNFFTIPKLFSYRGAEIKLSQFFTNIKSLKDIYIWDGFVYNSLPEFGTLYIFSIPIMILGIIIQIIKTIKDIKNKKFSIDALMLIIWIANIICIGLTENMNVNKANSIFIPSIYSIYIALKYIYYKKNIFFTTIIIMYLINFVIFTVFYFKDYNNRYAKIQFFDQNLISLTRYLNKYENENIYFKIKTTQPWAYTLYANEVSPYDFNNTIHEDNSDYWTNTFAYGKYYFDLPEKIEQNSVYVIEGEEEIEKELINNGYNLEEYLEYKIYSK